MALTLNQLIQRYLQYLAQAGKHPRTLASYAHDVQIIETFFGADKDIEAISIQQVGRFLKSSQLFYSAKGKEKAPRSIQKTVRVLRMLLVWASKQGYINEAPLPRSVYLGK